MKTVEQKATEFMEKLDAERSVRFDARNFDSVKQSLVLLLKHQDRDTRHACAEAVIGCEEDVSGECIWKDDAHSAVMNTQAL